VPLVVPMKAGPYWAHAQFSDLATVLALPDPGAELPYLQVAWRYARGVAFAQSGNREAARTQLAEIERIVNTADYSAFSAWGIPAKEVALIAGHVLRARIAQAGNELDGAIRELRAAVEIQDALPYMEPPYWYYPVRQSLAVALMQAGRLDDAEGQFRRALARAPNNGWSYYGLAELYKTRGDVEAARKAQAELAKTWVGDRQLLQLSKL
jgi:tetratricopeptide (TPR) repeat protein